MKGVTQRKDGSYYVRRTCPDGFKLELYSIDYNELVKKMETEIKNHSLVDGLYACDYTLDEWFHKWFDEYKRPNIAITSVHPMLSQVEHMFLDKIGHVKIKSLRNNDVQKALAEVITSKKYANKSVREGLNRLKKSLDSAVNNKLILSNPCYDLEVPSNGNGRKDTPYEEYRFLSTYELDMFLFITKNDWYYELYVVMIYMGLRIGEIGGLNWSDVDLAKGEIKLNQAMHYQHAYGEKLKFLGDLKTRNSYRKIPIPDNVRKVFESQRVKVEKLKNRLGNRFDKSNDELVFLTTRGTPIIRHTIERALTSVTEDMRIYEAHLAASENRMPTPIKNIFPHALRHTFASIMYEAGVDAKTTQKLMGHASVKTTLDIYTHLTNEHVDEEVDKLNKYISNMDI